MKVRANTRRQELHNYNHYYDMITVPQVWQLPHPTCPPAASPPFGRLSASIQLILLLLQLDVDHGLLLLEQLQPLLLRP